MNFPLARRIPKDLKQNLLWRSKVQRRAADDPGFADAIREACAVDPLFFLNGFGWTFDPRRLQPKVPFILYGYQEEALLEILDAIGDHDLLLEKSRDMGASWLCVMSMFWRWLFKQMQSFLLVSRVEEYVDASGNPKSMFWKIDFTMDNLPRWLRPRGYNTGEHRRKLHIENPENGSVIDGESTNQNVARGDRRTAILLDEFAAVENGHRVLGATRDATNCRIFNSTLGETGHDAFGDMRRTDIKKLRLHWSTHPLKNRGLYTTAEDGTLKTLISAGYPAGYAPILDGKLRSPWYDNECKRAVDQREIARELDIDDTGATYQFFSADAIRQRICEYARPAILVGDLEYDNTTAEPLRFREDATGNLRLWCLLDKNNDPPKDHKYVLGVDVSAGTGSSNSCISGWDAATSEKVMEFVSPYVRPEALAKQAVAIAKWLGGALMIWEANGPGRQFGSRVIDLGYGNVYFRQREEALSKKTSDVPGWAATKETKLVLMGEYRAAVEGGACVNRSKEAMQETLEYVFQPGGGVGHSRELNKTDPSGAGASHGDRVVADALAWRGLTERTRQKQQETPEVPVGCLAWRQKQRELAKPKVGVELGEGW